MHVNEMAKEWCAINAAMLEGMSAIDVVHAWEEYMARSIQRWPTRTTALSELFVRPAGARGEVNGAAALGSARLG